MDKIARELVKLARELTSEETAEQERASEESGYILESAVTAMNAVVTLNPTTINGQAEKNALNLLKKAHELAKVTDNAEYIKSIVEIRNQFKKSINGIRKEFATHQKVEADYKKSYERWQKTTKGLLDSMVKQSDKMLEKSLEIAGGWD